MLVTGIHGAYSDLMEPVFSPGLSQPFTSQICFDSEAIKKSGWVLIIGEGEFSLSEPSPVSLEDGHPRRFKKQPWNEHKWRHYFRPPPLFECQEMGLYRWLAPARPCTPKRKAFMSWGFSHMRPNPASLEGCGCTFLECFWEGSG